MKTLFLFLILTYMIFPFEVVELKQPNSNKIVIKLMFMNGSQLDPAGKEGLTQLTSSLIVQGGTKDMTYSEIQDKIYPWAASYGSSADKDVTVFTFSVHKDFLDEFYPIIRDLILYPAFDEKDFQRVKDNQQNFVDQVIRASSDEEYSKKALEDLLFRGTPYQHMTAGTSEGVASITLDDVKNYYKEFFTVNNLLLGIAGNYSENFLNQFKADMKKLPDVRVKKDPTFNFKNPDGVNVEIIVKDGAFGSAIFTGAPLSITRKDDDFAALMVANSWLGEHRKSYGQLYQKIRETRSMNYGNYTYIEWYNNGGSFQLPPSGVPREHNYFSIWIRPVQIGQQLRSQYEELKDVEIGHAHFALRMSVKTIDDLIKNGMTEKDFESTREFLRSYIKLYVSTPSEQLGYLMDSRFYGRKDYINELDQLLAKLTLEDVNKAIKKYLQVENMYVTIVTDRSEAEALAKSLRENLPSPMSYSDLVKSGLPESVLKEDDESAVYKLNIKEVKLVESKDTFKK